MPKLRLSYQQVRLLMNDELEGFKVLYDNIPKPTTLEELEDYDPNDYIDRHGDQTRNFIFKDLSTNNEYQLIYKLSNEYGFDPKSDCFLLNEAIEMYEEEVKPKVEEPKPLTDVQIRQKKIFDEYEAARKLETFNEMPEKGKQNFVPQSDIKDILTFLKKEKYSYIELQELVIPIATKNKVTHKSLWKYIQIKRGVWKV